jgi:hypothetical protein
VTTWRNSLRMYMYFASNTFFSHCLFC